jgi:adenine phosphoribosyltransferase
MTEDTYHVDICGVSRDLPLFEVAPGVRIALFNMLGDFEVVEALADWLAGQVPADFDAIMTAEVKSIPLAHALSVRARKPYIVARKTRKPYMLGSLSVEVLSITTGAPQLLWLDGKDLHLVLGKRILLVDDVISTGSTLAGMTKLVEEAGGKVVAEAAAFTEGNDPEKWKNIIAPANLPVFVGNGS